MKNGKHRYTREQVEFIKNGSSIPRMELYQLFINKFDVDLSYRAFKTKCLRISQEDTSGNDGIPCQYPVGAEVHNPDWIYVKVAQPNKWERKQRVVWEKNYGPIPEGHIVTFRDGDHFNCDPENLMLMSRQEMSVISSMGLQNSPAEMKDTIKLLASVHIQAKKRAKDAKRKRLD